MHIYIRSPSLTVTGVCPLSLTYISLSSPAELLSHAFPQRREASQSALAS